MNFPPSSNFPSQIPMPSNEIPPPEIEENKIISEILNIAKIKEGFYIGDKLAAISIELIFQFKITHIINTTGTQIRNNWESIGVKYLTLKWSDDESQILFDVKDEIANKLVEFIDEGVDLGEGLLVHSFRGQNRVCIVVLIYLMKKYKWSLNKSLEYLGSKKQDIDILPSFYKQLVNFEKRLRQRGELNDKDIPWEYDGLKNQEEYLLRNTFINTLHPKPVAIIQKQKKDSKKRIKWKEEINSLIDIEHDLFLKKNVQTVLCHKTVVPIKGCIKMKNKISTNKDINNNKNKTMMSNHNNNNSAKIIKKENNNNLNEIKNFVENLQIYAEKLYNSNSVSSNNYNIKQEKIINQNQQNNFIKKQDLSKSKKEYINYDSILKISKNNSSNNLSKKPIIKNNNSDNQINLINTYDIPIFQNFAPNTDNSIKLVNNYTKVDNSMNNTNKKKESKKAQIEQFNIDIPKEKNGQKGIYIFTNKVGKIITNNVNNYFYQDQSKNKKKNPNRSQQINNSNNNNMNYIKTNDLGKMVNQIGIRNNKNYNPQRLINQNINHVRSHSANKNDNYLNIINNQHQNLVENDNSYLFNYRKNAQDRQNMSNTSIQFYKNNIKNPEFKEMNNSSFNFYNEIKNIPNNFLNYSSKDIYRNNYSKDFSIGGNQFLMKNYNVQHRRKESFSNNSNILNDYNQKIILLNENKNSYNNYYNNNLDGNYYLNNFNPNLVKKKDNPKGITTNQINKLKNNIPIKIKNNNFIHTNMTKTKKPHTPDLQHYRNNGLLNDNMQRNMNNNNNNNLRTNSSFNKYGINNNRLKTPNLIPNSILGYNFGNDENYLYNENLNKIKSRPSTAPQKNKVNNSKNHNNQIYQMNNFNNYKANYVYQGNMGGINNTKIVKMNQRPMSASGKNNINNNNKINTNSMMKYKYNNMNMADNNIGNLIGQKLTKRLSSPQLNPDIKINNNNNFGMMQRQNYNRINMKINSRAKRPPLPNKMFI